MFRFCVKEFSYVGAHIYLGLVRLYVELFFNSLLGIKVSSRHCCSGLYTKQEDLEAIGHHFLGQPGVSRKQEALGSRMQEFRRSFVCSVYLQYLKDYLEELE